MHASAGQNGRDGKQVQESTRGNKAHSGLWQPSLTSCDQSHEGVRLARNRTDNFLVDFEIKASGEKVGLIAATNSSNSENCPNAEVGIDVTDKTLEAAIKSVRY